MRFNQVTQERYDEMLGVVPPAIMTGNGFLVGEPWRHNDAGQPMFAGFVHYIGRCWEAAEPMTIAEFKDLGPPSRHKWFFARRDEPFSA